MEMVARNLMGRVAPTGRALSLLLYGPAHDGGHIKWPPVRAELAINLSRRPRSPGARAYLVVGAGTWGRSFSAGTLGASLSAGLAGKLRCGEPVAGMGQRDSASAWSAAALRCVASLLACCAGKRFAFPQLRTLAGSNPSACPQESAPGS